MKIITVVGARPQVLKAAQLTPWLRKLGFEEFLVHTGQHFSDAMSQAFFREFGLREPDAQLDINRMPRGPMIGTMTQALDPIFDREKPSACLVFGDTNTTLAGALAAHFRQIPVVHIEAGLRSYRIEMPEEGNRVLTDRIAHLNLAPNQAAMANLDSDGLAETAVLSGDLMADSLRETLAKVNFEALKTPRGILVTLHREALTSSSRDFESVLGVLSELARSLPVTVIRHPRVDREELTQLLGPSSNVSVIEPQAHLELVTRSLEAELVITDSGGLQREAAFLGLNCVVARSETEWDDLLEDGVMELMEPGSARLIRQALRLSSNSRDPIKVKEFMQQESVAFQMSIVIQDSLTQLLTRAVERG